jgi:hypothetical protein
MESQIEGKADRKDKGIVALAFKHNFIKIDKQIEVQANREWEPTRLEMNPFGRRLVWMSPAKYRILKILGNLYVFKIRLKLNYFVSRVTFSFVAYKPDVTSSNPFEQILACVTRDLMP